LGFFGFFGARRAPLDEPPPAEDEPPLAGSDATEPPSKEEAERTLESSIGAALEGRLDDGSGPRYEIREGLDGWYLVDRLTGATAEVHGFVLERLNPRRAKSLAEVLNRTDHRRGDTRRAA
jgi:hypothetical protein